MAVFMATWWRMLTSSNIAVVIDAFGFFLFFFGLVLPCGPCARVIYSDRSLQAFTHLYGWDIIGRAKQDNADDGNFWSRQSDRHTKNCVQKHVGHKGSDE